MPRKGEQDIWPEWPAWKATAIYLGLPDDILKSLEQQEYEEGGHKAVSGMVDAWLKWNYNYKRFRKPSWKKLVEAIGAEAGGNSPEIAQRIADQHRKYHSSVINTYNWTAIIVDLLPQWDSN